MHVNLLHCTNFVQLGVIYSDGSLLSDNWNDKNHYPTNCQLVWVKNIQIRNIFRLSIMQLVRLLF